MRTARTLAVSAVILAACGGGTPPRPAPPPAAAPSELSPALAPLAWWLGAWEIEPAAGAIEQWIAASGAIYGVALHPNGTFEVMIVDDGEGPGAPDGTLRFIAMPAGRRSVEFRQRAIATGSALFANDAHDFPKAIRYHRDGEALAAELTGDGEPPASVRFRRIPPPPPAPALEAADRAFAADTAARGVEGWVAAFAPDGWMLRKGEPVRGAALGDMMKPVLTSGRLAWAPIASGLAPGGTLGFTIGKATFTGATPADGWRSTYVTIWRVRADGTWKVEFDTGRAVQD